MFNQSNIEQLFVNIHNILSDNGCLLTNAYRDLTEVLSSTFQSNILLAYNNNNNNNMMENTNVIISGSIKSTKRIASKEQAINEAQRLDSNAHLEFSLAKILSLGYQGPLTKKLSSD